MMLSTIKPFQARSSSLRQVGLGFLILCFLFTPQMGLAIDIADVPMATKIQKAPPNIMFVLDNSGSMDRSFMADYFGGQWRTRSNALRSYVFDDPGDNIYSASKILDGSDRAEWQSQWSGANKIYYNPQTEYKPWPSPTQDPTTEEIERMENASTTTPISNPYFLIDSNLPNDNTTLNLEAIYYTVPAGALEVIVDDLDGAPGFTTTGNWLTPSSHTPNWNGHSPYTRQTGATATFTPTLPSDGSYDVYAWWNCYIARDKNAKITVTYADEATGASVTDTNNWDQSAPQSNVPQPGVCGEWRLLGTYYFQAGDSGSVTIERHSGSTPDTSTVADAVRFVGSGSISTVNVNIYNAHYYTQGWTDVDGDGIEDPDELTSYLVNFNQGVREVYQIQDVNNNDFIDDSSELILIGGELPESIRPKLYDDDGNVVGVRDAANELQNFANWYSFYRRRELAAKAAVAEVIASAEGVNVGFYSLSNNNGGVTRQPVLHVRVPGEMDNTGELLTHLYMMDSSGWTPLRRSLQNVGRYFDATDHHDGGLGQSPYYTVEKGGACQHSFAITITDGYWNRSSPGVGNTDGNKGKPYADDVSNTLADVAMYYYNRDLSTDLPDELPPSDCDLNTAQHMVTFSISFGLNGNIDIEDMNGNGKPDAEEDFDEDGNPDGLSYEADPCFLNSNTPRPEWPSPLSSDSPDTIDDLWHAAVNGRGEFFSASDPQELVAALTKIFDVVGSVNASDAAVTIDGEVISSETRVFGPSYDSTTWTGDLKAVKFDEDGNLPYDDNGLIPDSAIDWKASTKLMSLDWDKGRNIVTISDTSGNNGIPFRWSNLSVDQKALLENDKNVLNYIRGDNDISGFRVRTNNDMITENILGDIVHSSPVLSKSGDTVFIGANDGMLHAFNAKTGEERFAYIPSLVYAHLADLKEPVYDHKFFVDATPSIWPGVDGNIDLLVGGLGKGGKGYYALNVADADGYGPGQESDIAIEVPLWEYPAPDSTDTDMGYSFSKPFIVKSNATGLSSSDGWVVIFGNGYNSTNGHAVLYVVDAVSGDLVKKINTHAGSDNGLSTPGLIDLNLDYKVDVVYAGDLKGNMWKFDLTDSNPSNWHVDFGGKALFTAVGPSKNTNPQPITTKPAVMKHPTRHGLMVLFGTGKFLGESDRTNTDTQSLYGIWDFSDTDNNEYLGTFERSGGAYGLSNLYGIKLLEQTIVFQDSSTSTQSQATTFGTNGTDGSTAVELLRVTSDEKADWSVTADSGDKSLPDPAVHAGWFFDMHKQDKPEILGERLIEDPLIRNGLFIAVTIIPDSGYCSGGGWSIINEFDAEDGSRPASPSFDVTGAESGGSNDGKVLINASDKINLAALPGGSGDDGYVAATGILKPKGGILHLSEGSIVEMPGRLGTELKIFSSSTGRNEEVIERAEKRGITFWREH